MRRMSRTLAMLGVLIFMIGIIGRLYGAPTVLGHTATSIFVISNTFLLFSMIVRDLRK